MTYFVPWNLLFHRSVYDQETNTESSAIWYVSSFLVEGNRCGLYVSVLDEKSPHLRGSCYMKSHRISFCHNLSSNFYLPLVLAGLCFFFCVLMLLSPVVLSGVSETFKIFVWVLFRPLLLSGGVFATIPVWSVFFSTEAASLFFSLICSVSWTTAVNIIWRHAKKH